MATHDYVISNASGAAVRADLNNALAAIVTNNSSATAPTTTYAYQWWADTGSSPAVMKLRNAANSAWITLFQLDGEWSTLAVENGTAAAPSIYFKDSGTDTGFYSPGTDQIGISTGGTSAVVVDASQRLLVGTVTARTLYPGFVPTVQIETGTSAAANISIVSTENAIGGANFWLGHGRGTNGLLNNNDELGAILFNGGDGTDLQNIGAKISAEVDGTPGNNDLPTRLVFSTTADGASSPTERMRITNDGNVSIGGNTAPTYRTVIRVGNTTQTSGSFLIENSSAVGSVYFFNVSGSGVNTNASAMWIEKNTSTNRSINAGGTVNASGADYAEYMVKAGDFDIAKGAVCGVTADGLLTLDYGDAVSFVVKSTNPSYVGGDTWGSEDVVGKKPKEDDADALVQWEADLETARQAVDRIAFAGQVPVNVLGATPGQYIVPVEASDGGIEGIAKNEADLTLAEYMRAVGKVIAIEDDGRARIIVKVA